MGRFLLAWEYGEDLGHLRRVLPVGHALREHGHQVAFAFRDATRLGAASARGFPAWPAPVVPRPRVFNATPANAADVLLNLGLDDAQAIRGALRGWQALLDSVQPDVVVADYAPGALLAASVRGVRRATIGSGFALPARTTPFAAIREGPGTDAASRRALDERLAAVMARATGTAAFDLHLLFRGESNLLTTWPELDPLGPREEEYLGPIGTEGDGQRAAWGERAGPRVFAYLKPRDPRFGAALDALRACAGEALVAAPGCPEAVARAASGPRLQVFSRPLALRALLEQADLCMGHGGPGFAAAALRGGNPLLFLPMHLEHERIALRLRDQGLAVVATDPAQIRPALEAALADGALRERARDFARRHAQAHAADVATDAATRLARLLR